MIKVKKRVLATRVKNFHDMLLSEGYHVNFESLREVMCVMVYEAKDEADADAFRTEYEQVRKEIILLNPTRKYNVPIDRYKLRVFKRAFDKANLDYKVGPELTPGVIQIIIEAKDEDIHRIQGVVKRANLLATRGN